MLKNGLAEKTRVPGSRRSRGVAGSENSYKRHVSCANPVGKVSMVVGSLSPTCL
jgi:hypothetical protein